MLPQQVSGSKDEILTILEPPEVFPVAYPFKIEREYVHIVAKIMIRPAAAVQGDSTSTYTHTSTAFNGNRETNAGQSGHFASLRFFPQQFQQQQ